MSQDAAVNPGSFRDPSGFVFTRDRTVFRQVNTCYKADYDLLMESGLYRDLTDAGLMVSHAETTDQESPGGDAYKILKPEVVPFVSYPYEWCFSQLKAAALLSLDIQKRALNHRMSLKDCSAYNIQFIGWRPVFIDTLSFEKYVEGKPWVAYRQFCQHFLAPLALMRYTDVRLGRILRCHIDGLPLDLTTRLLPMRCRFSPALMLHIWLHAASQRHYAGRPLRIKKKAMGNFALRGLIDSLESAIRKLRWRPEGTEWTDYYDNSSYTTQASEHKKLLVARFLAHTGAATAWDLGANTGVFSRVATSRGMRVISFDVDPGAVEKNYGKCVEDRSLDLLPLLLDLTNPSPGIGWAERERMSWLTRGPADVAMVLAMLHHLVIGNNAPFRTVANLLCRAGKWLIIEFVPKDDPQVQRLLASREDVFSGYTREVFEAEFARCFRIVDAQPVKDSKRVLYLMKQVST